MALSVKLGKAVKSSTLGTVTVFGKIINTPEIDFETKLSIALETSAFNVSTIDPFREIAVMLATMTDLDNDGGPVTISWYRDSDNYLMYEYEDELPDGQWGWYQFYSYTGYVPWEIWEDGAYHVTIRTPVGNITKYFTVTGTRQPLVFYVNESNYVRATAKNTSQRGGVENIATLKSQFKITSPGESFSQDPVSSVFAAGQSKTVNYFFTPTNLSKLKWGQAKSLIYDNSGNLLDSKAVDCFFGF